MHRSQQSTRRVWEYFAEDPKRLKWNVWNVNILFKRSVKDGSHSRFCAGLTHRFRHALFSTTLLLWHGMVFYLSIKSSTPVFYLFEALLLLMFTYLLYLVTLGLFITLCLPFLFSTHKNDTNKFDVYLLRVQQPTCSVGHCGGSEVKNYINTVQFLAQKHCFVS